ncbi:MAG: ParB/RepB/Spo0J family partition protein [Candidatus Bathyarchaeia archaeon]|jgi:ParB family chromosome partitioning protein
MISEDVRRIEVEKLDPNPFQPRIEYPQNELEELGRSLLNHGQVQPIIVRPKADRYEVAAGWRRVLAAMRAGIRDLLCIIQDLSDEQMAITAFVENLQRRDLNPVEDARIFQTLHDFGWTQERIAKEAGRGLTRDIVAQRLRLLSFPAELQGLVSHDTITATHAEALARLADKPSLLKKAITKVVEDKLTTKETEHFVEELLLNTKADRELILEYLTSPDFLYFIRYVMLNLPSHEWKLCPRCWNDSLVDDIDHTKCKEDGCGWSLDLGTPLRDLLN